MQVLVDGSDYFAAAGASRLVQSVLQGVQSQLAALVAPPVGTAPGSAPPVGMAPAGTAPGGAPLAGAAPVTPGPSGAAAGAGAAPSLVPELTVLFNPGLKSANVMIPGLLGMVLLFITALMTALGIVREREAGTLEQLVVTPIRPLELMLGKILPYALVGLVDFALVLLSGVFVFDVSFQGNLPLFTGLSVLFLLCTLSLGLLVSTLAQNQMQAIQMAMFMLFPQFLLSGFIFPLDAMPEVIRYLAYLFPLTYYIPIARGMFLKGAGLDLLVEPAIGLAVYAVVLVALASIRFRKRIA
jgi:ABC-2 type transport system permease protein